jgi:hypothetical protein
MNVLNTRFHLVLVKFLLVGCHPWARKGLFFEEKQRLFLTRGSKGSKILGLRNANVFL